jgi:DNA-binding PadR family transcriptional regulator
MFADNTLTPKETVRLCALGTLALGATHYGALANSIRHFISRITGPSLDVMGVSIELLKYEGLIELADKAKIEDDTELIITESGRRELKALLTANVRPAATEISKLVVALKFRFLHLLDGAERSTQAELLIEMTENELARLDDLHQHHANDKGYLVGWLDHDISLLEKRLRWLENFKKSLS